MKKILIGVGVILLHNPATAQKYFTKTATIVFDATSSSSPEKVEGKNRSAVCVIDSKTGLIQFSVLMKGFVFERALMEEHFNENYVESHKFPKSEFKGKIKDPGTIDLTRDGTYNVKVKGDLSIHGHSKEVETNGVLQVQGGKISANATFNVKLSDYDISVPGLVADKVAKTATITVVCSLEPLKN